MIEKSIALENVSLVDFLGVNNQFFREIASAFPKSKIVSRGDTIIIQGRSEEVIRIQYIFSALLEHYHKYNHLTSEAIRHYLEEGGALYPAEGEERHTILYGTQGIVIKPKTPQQAKLVEAISRHAMVFAVGPAGTGKTYLAVATAVRALRNREVKKIILTRPAIEAGESLGFLPGDLKEKVDPYLRPIYDALRDMIPAEKLKYYQETNTIEIAPLAYMRGRTLKDAFVILDEAQNTTSPQMKMFLTRMGTNAKFIITGDVTQRDLPKNTRSGLIEAIEALKGVKDIAFIKLTSQDVVRGKLVETIIGAYAQHEQKKELCQEILL